MEKKIWLFLLFVIVFITSASSDQSKFILGEDNLGRWKNGILSSSAASEAPGPADGPSGSLVLAGSRTKRPDILNHFKRYRGGWDHGTLPINITGQFQWLDKWTLSRIGCILLSVGQDEFHAEAVDTLNYVVNQSDYTVQTLINVMGYLSLAKTVNVAQNTHQNSRKIRTVFDTVRLSMIAIAIVMILDSLLGLFLSILGHKNTIYIFITSGWLLVVVTFILCGVFVIIHNAIADTCMAMGQWVDNQQAETALSDILPCVDQGTTIATLYKSKLVVNDIANIINGFIGSFANSNAPLGGNSNYYNQSGPLMPYLCYPYDSQLHEMECPSQLVSMANASMVCQNYTCSISESGICTTTGRLTPDMYQQLVGAVNISYALQHYVPPLLSLQDCNFVRQTFRIIISDHCPPLEDHLRMVNVGLALVSVGVMLSLALWIIYANRPQSEQVFAKISSKFKSGCNGDTAIDVSSNNN
ncbi:hypothetical protein L1987_06562 [Smallanthus sonchifolius]|uniref:Uncharacterized protein n=1 Tax=Smallanthus sonchifolius TaxID=185202 RepID=A0ACB9JYP2_9ASTR|nr:hypothetical protein L1987_06562 [Smallanthus sonchifolius]